MSEDKKKDEGPKMITLVKPNGTEVRINDADANIKKAAELGWLPPAEYKKAQSAKKSEDL